MSALICPDVPKTEWFGELKDETGFGNEWLMIAGIWTVSHCMSTQGDRKFG